MDKTGPVIFQDYITKESQIQGILEKIAKLPKYTNWVASVAGTEIRVASNLELELRERLKKNFLCWVTVYPT